MCGFASLIEPGRRFPPPLLAAMERDLQHRGPDSGGVVAEPGVALVFRRLAILDPTSRSDQPMNDASGRCTIVFNGEIYNYRAVRAALVQAGTVLTTDGDTEAVLAGYLRWGEAVLDRLDGMYAFTLVDRRRGVALAARDPLGIKPLYRLRRGSLTAFASEMRPLHRLQPAAVDAAALAELLTFGWAAGRLSNYRDIERIPGGTLVTVSLADGAIRERRFCDTLATITGDAGASEADAHRTVQESVRAHLVSDVGYALQLSGGIDSSLVAALAARAAGERLHAYALTLEGEPQDESRYQREVTSRYGLDLTSVPITGDAYADALPRAVATMEGPTPHGGCVMLMLLCETIRRRHKVVLTGEGGDEMFGGYIRYAWWRRLMWHERLGKVLPAAALPARWPFAGIRRLAGVDAAAYAGVHHDFQRVHEAFPELVPAPGAREAASRRFTDFRDRLFAVDQTCYLESLLVRQDKMSMASSVEARVPFVHRPLLAVVNRLRRRERVPGNDTKPILKRLADRYLPHDLVHRRKVGLALPYGRWFADDRLAGRYLTALTDGDSRLAAYAARPALARIADDARSGARSGGGITRLIVETELWLRQAEARPPGVVDY
ncbi:MAG: asparagine synthase (glutamine-hydrolyzing) [Rhodospirillales bacterium]|nr:asparagine synthase (glutamine-hydrolyzing) [Rhodospirillales bacterium]